MKSALADLRPYRVDQDASGVKLNQNESPYDVPAGLKRKILADLARVPWNRYPPHPPSRLIKTLARSLGLPEAGCVVGNSSNEIILATLQSYCRPGDRLVTVSPGFPIYPRVGRILGLTPIDVPLGADFAFDIGPLVSASRSAAATILASPNNPTGTALDRRSIRDICGEARGIVVIDEAYHEFQGENAAALLRRHPNLILIRTFSKAFGLAGARLGYLLARPEVARTIEKVKLPFSVGAWPQAAAIVILENPAFRDRIIQRTLRERSRVLVRLREIPGISPLPSQANFILFGTGTRRAAAVARGLARQGVLIRTFDHPRLGNHARVTIGTPAENTIFLTALRRLMEGREVSGPDAAPV